MEGWLLVVWFVDSLARCRLAVCRARVAGNLSAIVFAVVITFIISKQDHKC